MPYRVIWEPQGVFRQYYGDVTIAERRASFDLICGDARFDSLRYTITDYLSVVGYEVTSPATAEIAALHIAPLAINPRIVMAAVATRPDVVAAIQDFAGLGFTSTPYRVFAELTQARAWIAAHLASLTVFPRPAPPARPPS